MQVKDSLAPMIGQAHYFWEIGVKHIHALAVVEIINWQRWVLAARDDRKTLKQARKLQDAQAEKLINTSF